MIVFVSLGMHLTTYVLQSGNKITVLCYTVAVTLSDTGTVLKICILYKSI